MNIEVNSKAICFFQAEIILDAPIELVFETLADINNWPDWQNNVTMANIDGITKAGKYFTWKANGFTIKSQLHTVKLYTEIGWIGKIWWIKAIHNWYLLPEDKSTKVLVKESLHGFGSSLMKKTLEDGILKNLADLKNKVEHN